MPPIPASLTGKVRPLSFEAGVVFAGFLGAVPVFATEAGTLHLVEAEPRTVAAHAGPVLSAAGDGTRLLTGGDDGCLVETRADGVPVEIAVHKGRWIDRVALGPSGALAWSAGKTAFVRDGKGGATGETKSFDAPSTVGGLAFAPKGLRLAIAHYNGVTLWFPNAPAAKPEVLEWKGSHLGVAVSPDGRFVVTTMQEPALHGWRVVDGAHMRMRGYPSRVRSFGFTVDGKWLATSGSGELILWPFQAKDGPMGKPPEMLAPSATARVMTVACHPKDPVVAIGYDDGMVLMVRISDGAEILLRASDGAAVTAIGWHSSGGSVVFGTAGGSAGVLAF